MIDKNAQPMSLNQVVAATLMLRSMEDDLRAYREAKAKGTEAVAALKAEILARG